MKIVKTIHATITLLITKGVLWMAYFCAIGITKMITTLFGVQMMGHPKRKTSFEEPSGSDTDKRMY